MLHRWPQPETLTSHREESESESESGDEAAVTGDKATGDGNNRNLDHPVEASGGCVSVVKATEREATADTKQLPAGLIGDATGMQQDEANNSSSNGRGEESDGDW